MIRLGKTYKDIVTGFEGTATAITKYLTGCDRVMLTPIIKDGEIKESATFDINSVEETGLGCFEFFACKKEEGKRVVGGPELYKSRQLY